MVKIADFGISKRTDSTALRTRIGTEAYLAPEVRGFYTPEDTALADDNDEDESFSLAVDIWAVGAIVFRLIIGRPPFQSARELSRYVNATKPLPVEGHITEDCANFLAETMNASPTKRPTAEIAIDFPWIHSHPDALEDAVSEVSVAEPDTSLEIGWTTEPRPSAVEFARPAATDIHIGTQARLQLNQTLEGHSDAVQSVAFSHDGRRLASSSVDRTVLTWAVDAHGQFQRTGRLLGHAGTVWSTAFSPDGRWLASGSEDKSVILWIADDRDQLEWGETHYGHGDGVLSIAFSPDSRQLASGSRDMTILIWTFDSHGELGRSQTLKGHYGNVSSLAFSLDGSQLASNSNDHVVIIWTRDSQGQLQLSQRLEGHNSNGLAMAFSPDCHRLAFSSPNGVLVWLKDKHGQLQERQKLKQRGHILSIAFSSNGSWLASGSGLGKLAVWRADLDGILEGGYELPRLQTVVLSLAYSPDGNILVSGLGDGRVLIWK
jgi:WD40 repeat protein